MNAMNKEQLEVARGYFMNARCAKYEKLYHAQKELCKLCEPYGVESYECRIKDTERVQLTLTVNSNDVEQLCKLYKELKGAH